jgi:hypothetical protein
LWFLRGVNDQRELCVVETGRLGGKPAREVLCFDHCDAPILGSPPVHQRLGAQHSDHRRHRNREADLACESSSDIHPVALRRVNVMRIRIVHPQYVVTHPDGCAPMVLRIDRKYPPWSDDEVIDILRSFPDRNRVSHKPFGAQRGKKPANLDFAQGTGVPGPGIGVQGDSGSGTQRRIATLGLRLHLKALESYRVSGRA